MTIQQINYRGRKSRIGSVAFDDNKLAFFAGYHKCTCGNRGKILMNLDEAREFSRMIGVKHNREPIGLRITRRLSRHYGI